MGDHYERLGVPATASHEEIKRAYHRQARRHHPDIHAGGPPATVEAARRRMADINAAWSVLGDPARRRDYDATFAGGRPDPTSGQDVGPRYPEWFEPDADVPAAHLEEDPAPAARPAHLVVFVPVGLAAAVVVAFALGLVTGSPGLLGLAAVLMAATVAAFVCAPLLVMATRSRRGPGAGL